MEAGFKKYSIVIGAQKDETTGLYVPAVSENELIAILNLCAEKGIDAQIQLHSNLVREGYNVFTSAFPNINFKEYSALTGFFIVDEPSWDQLDYIRDNYVDWFNDNYANSGLEFYVNLLSGYSTWIGAIRGADGEYVFDENGNKLWDNATDEQKKTCLQAYHEKWLAIFKKINSENKYFTHDAYPLRDNQSGVLTLPDAELPEGYERLLSEEWLARSLNIAVQARENGYKYGAYIQAFDQETNNYRLPTKVEEIKWQAYMNIALGAKRLVYFGYDQSAGGTYMTSEGEPLPLYYLVQETNAELDKVDHVFAAFENWVGVKTFTPTGSEVCEAFQRTADMELDALTGVSSVTTDRELVVGEMMDENGNHGYMLVGYDDPYNGNSTQVEMTFENAEGVIIYRNGERTLVECTDGKLSITLSAGEGVFVIPV